MIRSGFFNSSNNDRLYDAEDMGKVFEGVISDGVFNNIGEKFTSQKIDNSMDIKILSGKAWFYNKYFEIVDYQIIDISPGNAEPRIDRLYLEIDNSRSGRVCKLNLQQGIPNPTPSPVVLQDTNEKKYIVLYDFRISANATNNSYVTIKSYIGEDGICPWATTTLDPRRGLFLFDSNSSEDISANEIKHGKVVFTSVGHESGTIGRTTDVTYDMPFGDDKTVIVITQVLASTLYPNSFFVDRAIVQFGTSNNNGRNGFRLDLAIAANEIQNTGDIAVLWMAIGISD